MLRHSRVDGRGLPHHVESENVQTFIQNHIGVTFLDNATIIFNVIKAVLKIFSTCQGDQGQSCQRPLVQQPFLPRQRLSGL